MTYNQCILHLINIIRPSISLPGCDLIDDYIQRYAAKEDIKLVPPTAPKNKSALLTKCHNLLVKIDTAGDKDGGVEQADELLVQE